MSNVRVLVSDKLSETGLTVLREASDVELEYKHGMSEDELCSVIGAFDGLIIRSGTQVTARVVDSADKLRAIGRAGIGVNNVDNPDARFPPCREVLACMRAVRARTTEDLAARFETLRDANENETP